MLRADLRAKRAPRDINVLLASQLGVKRGRISLITSKPNVCFAMLVSSNRLQLPFSACNVQSTALLRNKVRQ